MAIPDVQAPTMVGARVSKQERDNLDRLAKLHDRTPSREVHRAIRFYLAHYDEADRFLREVFDHEGQS